MFNVTGSELLIILFVALVVLGPAKLPEAARQVGKIIGEFKRISSGFQREMKAAMDDPLSKVTGEATPTSISDVGGFTPLPPVAEQNGSKEGTADAGEAAAAAGATEGDAAQADEPPVAEAASGSAEADQTLDDPEAPPAAPTYSDR